MCEDIEFNATGKEEFLAIAVKELPKFSWLNPNEAEPVPELNVVRLNKLWNWLQQQESWQVFNRTVQVV